MARLAVVGGGMGGLATALFAARRGHEVVVVDRDPGPPPGPPVDAGRWQRRGVAQAHFAHYFVAGSTRVVRAEAPELLGRLRDAGIEEAVTRFGPGFEQERALASRRLVYELVLQQAVREQAGVSLLRASVTGLLAGAGTDVVRGVRTAAGDEIEADVVVDAGGRRTSSARWLRALGLTEPAREEHRCGLHYYSRDYRVRDEEEYPTVEPAFIMSPYLGILVFPGDNRTFSVAIELSARDPLRRRLQDPDVFDAVLAAVPASADWVGRADPIGDLRVMAGLSNRRRRLVVDGRPAVRGLVLVGDAAVYTNPTLGQGVSLTFWTAQAVAEAAERLAVDPAGGLLAYEDWIDRELGPRFDRQVRADVGTRRQFDAGAEGADWLPPTDDGSRYLAALMQLAARDEEVEYLTRRVVHLLESPAAYDHPRVRDAVRPLLDAPPSPPPPPALSRSAFEALVTA